MFKLFLILFLLLPQSGWSAKKLTANMIVKKADQVRNPQLDYKVDVKVKNFKPKSNSEKIDVSESEYEVLIKGKSDSVIKTLAPSIDRGRTLLMKDTNMWAFMPDVSKPIRVSLQQRLVGEVSNGDLARANFSGDYDAKIIKRTKKNYILKLTANRDDVTYHSVMYWVRKKSFHPVKAKFYALSGRHLKTCFYKNYKRFGGRLRPTQLVMINALTKGQKSVINYSNLVIGKLQEKIFSKNYLKRLDY